MSEIRVEFYGAYGLAAMMPQAPREGDFVRLNGVSHRVERVTFEPPEDASGPAYWRVRVLVE